jgi:catechol 2,3-dioxygenase-like lactoylglutathione lyase family enzyme
MTGFAEHRRVATVALVVANYDEAISWYVGKLGFLLIEDVDLGGGKRWVTVAGQRTRRAAAAGRSGR